MTMDSTEPPKWTRSGLANNGGTPSSNVVEGEVHPLPRAALPQPEAMVVVRHETTWTMGWPEQGMGIAWTTNETSSKIHIGGWCCASQVSRGEICYLSCHTWCHWCIPRPVTNSLELSDDNTSVHAHSSICCENALLFLNTCMLSIYIYTYVYTYIDEVRERERCQPHRQWFSGEPCYRPWMRMKNLRSPESRPNSIYIYIYTLISSMQ